MRIKKICVPVIISISLCFAVMSFSGCFMGDEDSVVTYAPSDGITRGLEGIALSSGIWAAKTAGTSLFGVWAEKTGAKLVPSIFADPTGAKLDEVLSQMAQISSKLDNLTSQMAGIQKQIGDLSASLKVDFLNLDTSISQKLGNTAIAGIDVLWKDYNNLIIKVDGNHSRQDVIANCTAAVFLNFAISVEPGVGNPDTRRYIQEINNLLITDGLSSYGSGGLLKLWTDQAIIGYMKSARTEADLINAYNYVESNFQQAMLYEAKGATMVITALQSIEIVDSSKRPTSAQYRMDFDAMLAAQGAEFRKHAERLVLSCANIKTSTGSGFLPAGYARVFERADYIYAMLAGQMDANGVPVYGLYGRVISPVDLAASGTTINAGSLGTLNFSEKATYASQTVSGGAIVAQKIDSWKTEFLQNVTEPVSTLTLSDNWHVYRYWKRPLAEGSQGIVNIELNNSLKTSIPIIYSNPAIASYDEASFTPYTAATSGSHLVKYGSFTVQAGFAGNSVFFALPKASPQSYVWYPFLWTASDNAYSRTTSLFASSDNGLPSMGSSGESYDNGEMVNAKQYLQSSLRKIIKCDNATVTGKFHIVIDASGYNRFDHGADGSYDNFIGLQLSSSDTPTFSSSTFYEDGKRLQRSSDEREPAIDSNVEGPQINFSEQVIRDINITMTQGKYYRIALYANIYCKASGYFTNNRGFRSHGTVFALGSTGKLNQCYFTFQ